MGRHGENDKINSWHENGKKKKEREKKRRKE